ASGGIESAAAGAVLVGFKALLITLLAWTMMQTRRLKQSMWAPAFCTGLAILTLLPRALLQPTVFSFLLLGVTLYLLHRPYQLRARDSAAQRTYEVYWWLVPLFVLWVNLDGWFLLGPLTVGLWWVGGVLQQTFAPLRTGDDAPEGPEQRTLGVVFLVS